MLNSIPTLTFTSPTLLCISNIFAQSQINVLVAASGQSALR